MVYIFLLKGYGKSVVRFLVACLVSELLNDKDNSYPASCFIIRSIYYFNDVTSREECIKLAVSCLNAHEIFQKLFNLWKKYRHTNRAIFNIAHLSYVLLKENKFYPACDVMDFSNIQDGGRLISLSYLCP